MITADQIQQLNNIFIAREAKLFHACQYIDFRSYITVGGIPSRHLLEEGNLPFTAFDTDGRDHQNNVWDKVFVNLHDFGGTFASAGAAVPNTFGPILFVMSSSTFRIANSVAICMRSAGALGFNREAESIEIDQVESLFAHPIEVGPPRKSYVKFARELRNTFPDAHEPEVSCAIDGQMFPLNNVAYIIVDPYVFNGVSLSDYVRRFLEERLVNIRVIERNTRNGRSQDLYNELIGVISNNTIDSIETLLAGNISDEMRSWAGSIRALWWQVPRFATYLRVGTINPLTNN